MTLSDAEINRYARHLILPEFGIKGQEKLKNSSVLLIGAGGLGSPMALYLAAAGVGKIGIVDFDVVDESNLQRQIVHGTSTLGQPKLKSAMDRLKDLNPHIEVVGFEERLTSENALRLFKDFDLVADGTDNFPTRYLVNDACVLLGKPNVYASIFRFEGQVTVFNHENGPCYRCLYHEPPPPGLVPSCAEGGVLGILPGVVGSLQATEVIKVLTGMRGNLSGKLLMYDAYKMAFRKLKIRKNPNCPLCSENPTQTELIDYELFCGIGQAEPEQVIEEISVQELQRKRDTGESFTLIDVREPHEVEIVSIEGATHIPLGELEDRLPQLDESAAYVMHCKLGGRSAKATRLMLKHGFSNVKNVMGGITAWAKEVDTALPTY